MYTPNALTRSGWFILSVRSLAIFVTLLTLWLLLSGLYKPLLVSLGVISSALVTYIVVRLDLLAARDAPLKSLAFLRYIATLIVDIGRADWAVTKVILGPSDAIRQRFLCVPARQRSEIGRMLFANSITITPGTVCFETESTELYIHALNDEAGNREELEALGKRVCAIEGDG